MKLRTVRNIGGTTRTTDYCGNMVYENGSPKVLLTEEGYVTLSDGRYHYYLKNHQGNNRVVLLSSEFSKRFLSSCPLWFLPWNTNVKYTACAIYVQSGRLSQ